MPDLERLAPAFLIAAMALVLLWFTFGTQANIHKGNRILRWLQGGLGVLGPRTTLRWLGSSVAELTIVEPTQPFREAIVLVVLEPRDMGAIWALARSRGRRDFVILRLSLVRSPLHRADVVDPAAWTAGHLADRPAEDRPEHMATWTDGSGTAIELHHDLGVSTSELKELWDRIGRVSGGAWRISIRPTVPHLEIHFLPPDPDRVSARRLLDEVRDIAVGLIPAR
jgi:hypothetical protein